MSQIAFQLLELCDGKCPVVHQDLVHSPTEHTTLGGAGLVGGPPQGKAAAGDGRDAGRRVECDVLAGVTIQRCSRAAAPKCENTRRAKRQCSAGGVRRGARLHVASSRIVHIPQASVGRGAAAANQATTIGR